MEVSRAALVTCDLGSPPRYPHRPLEPRPSPPQFVVPPPSSLGPLPPGTPSSTAPATPASLARQVRRRRSPTSPLPSLVSPACVPPSPSAVPHLEPRPSASSCLPHLVLLQDRPATAPTHQIRPPPRLLRLASHHAFPEFLAAPLLCSVRAETNRFSHLALTRQRQGPARIASPRFISTRSSNRPKPHPQPIPTDRPRWAAR